MSEIKLSNYALITELGIGQPLAEVTINCPNCNTIQQAMIRRGVLGNIYLHDCEDCGYTIMESEWNQIDNTENKTQ
jgi:predicted RNA-binding Zn-ribbon protein involved in translation (DUF1610 family)